MTGKTYVIYYGWLSDDDSGEPNEDAHRIAAARVPLLIANVWTAEPERHRNLSEAVLALMRASGANVFAYTATRGGAVARRDVEREMNDYFDAGVDGIFFDEADPLREETHFAYYEALARVAHDRGGRVIVNPGVGSCGERIMDVADMVMLEHRWRDLREGSPWSARYPADRFMGVSSNEENAMGYAVDETRAIADTREAWARGVGWHSSTERYIELPEWFDTYMQAVR